MNPKILLSILALASLTQLGESSPESILKELANINFSSQEDLASKCGTYEKFLGLNYPKLFRTGQGDGARIQGLLSVLRATGNLPEAGSGLAFMNQLSECAELLARLEAKHAGSVDTINEPRAVRVEFDSLGLAKLSKARQDVKSLPLDRRCETYDEVLREILAGQEAARESKPVLFRSALRALEVRQVPFLQGGQAPFVQTLAECVSKLSAFQDEPTTPRTVIAGPVHPREQLIPAEVNPVENMRNEFEQVKKNVVDHGQDLYAGPSGSEDELNYRPSEIDDEIEYGIDVDVPPPSPGSQDFEIDSNERYRPHSNGQHAGLMNQYILDDTYDEMARREHDPVKKLELLLESERRENKRLLQQLDDNQYEIGDLKEQNIQLKKVLGTSHSGPTKSNPLEESRLFEMKRLYEQASEREARTNDKYELLLRKYEDLEARFMLERTMGGDKYADMDEDDDDDDDDDDDYDDSDGEDKELKKWLKKDKKALEKQEKKAKKAEKEFRKKEEKATKKLEKVMKKSVEKTENGEKIYRDPVDMARKLQNRMRSSEAPEQRCQKYYALLNHPGKVTKKLLKAIAKLNLPKASIHDPEYFSSLNYYADLLSRSDNKDAREASAEMALCLQAHPVGNHHSQVLHHGGYEVNSDYEMEDQYPSMYADNYDGGLLGNNYFQQNKRSFRDRFSSNKPKASTFEVPVEFVTSPTNSKRKSLARGDSNKYAAYGQAAASVDGATAFARFAPSSKLAQFQAEHY